MHGKANNPRESKKKILVQQYAEGGIVAPCSQCAAAGQLLLTQRCPAVKPEQSLQVGPVQFCDSQNRVPLPHSWSLLHPVMSNFLCDKENLS